MANIGHNIKLLRISKKMTQEDLGAKLFTTRQTISNYETGKSNPDIDTLMKIAEVFKVDINTMIYGLPSALERRREYRRTIIAVCITVLAGITLGVLASHARDYARNYYITAPYLLIRAFLSPCSYTLLGWTFAQTICMIFKIKLPNNKSIKTSHTSIIVLIALYIIIAAPYLFKLIYIFFRDINSISIYGAAQDYSVSMHVNALWDTLSYRLITYSIKFSYLFAFPGALLRITKAYRAKSAENTAKNNI